MIFVVLSFNKTRLTTACLESCLKCGIKAKDILWVDNGSEERHWTRVREEFPDLPMLRLEKNGGYGYGANQGLTAAFRSSSDAFFLSNDCRLSEDPRPALERFLRDRRVDMLAPAVHFVRDTAKLDSCAGCWDPRANTLLHYRTRPENPRRLAYPEYIPGSSYYVTRDLFEGLGGFDESFFAYWEDVDLSVRAHRSGYHLWMHPGIRVLHHGRGTTGKNRHYTKELFERNRERFRQEYAV